MPATPPDPSSAVAPRRPRAAARRATRVVPLAVLLALPLAACGDDGDGGDLESLCAVAGGRDLAANLAERAAGPEDPVEVPQGTFAPETLDEFSRSFADILVEDSPPEVREDAERYREALLASIDGRPPDGDELEAAEAAGDRLTEFLATACGDTTG